MPELDLRATFERHVQLWNEGRFDEWVTLFPGDDIELEDPVGRPVKRGKQETLIGPWERAQATTRIEIVHMVAVGNELAVYARNITRTDNGDHVLDSIEIYQWDETRLRGRIFYDMPTA